MGNTFKTAILLGVLTGMLVLIAGALGGRQWMYIAFVMALVMNFASYWYSDKIVLAMYRAQEIPYQQAPELHGIVERLSERAGIPKPRIYVIPDDSPNAFATGRDPAHAAVAATEGIMRLLGPDELEGVLAHELAHVKNRDILIGTIAATLAMAITSIASMARWAAIFGGFSRDREDGESGAGLLVTAILAPIAAMLVQMAVSRSREYQADHSGAMISGKPNGLANALLKLERGSEMMPLEASPATAHLFIVSPFNGRGMANLFSTHPPIQERVRRLQQMAQSGEAVL